MRFGKLRMFLFLNGAILFALLCYSAFWLLFGETVMGKVVTPYLPNTITVQYKAKGDTFKKTYMRNGVPFSYKEVSVRYLSFSPSSSRINSFMGFLAEPLAWWFVFLLASAMLLLTNNTVFSRGTIFQLHKGFPWISMEEYFPDYHTQYYHNATGSASTPKKERRKALPSGGKKG